VRTTDWAQTLCRAAVEQLGVDAAAITLRAGRHTQDLVAATSEWAQRLEELQYTTGEGPGVEAFTLGTAVLVADIGPALPRWPGFCLGAAEADADAVFAFPLGRESTVIGTFDLYRHDTGPLSVRGTELATLLADVTAKALAAAHPIPAGNHYAQVDIAAGMVAAQLGVPVDEALLRLRAAAFRQDRSVVDVARDVAAWRLRLDRPE
jgi:hypothetical protein